MALDDPFDLARFRSAQEPIFEAALAELHAGRKRSHWMWFVFPQLRGLGRSPTAQHYGISSQDEARAYLADAVLGERLHHATAVVLGVNGRSAHEIFGSPDHLKFRSSMTLFGETAGVGGSIFHQALDRFFDGERDLHTLDLL
ncbi:DUF1810 domain-containing protein [Mesorhizobium sp. CO1-1-8]|uniref:DUF1810 domain-containing protein n=1 Tax=Mesorhizobium sp. CO1-1-8 TaxID=2876631 RepID=UPI001CD175CD|nr:DUF1810 domain-containing protein [Mesorhizobium sp. CO1-1-8]MBZ9777123.1 DUF1810 domain-containing protein [Mesorhizobium sp. CO1-1-8]